MTNDGGSTEKSPDRFSTRTQLQRQGVFCACDALLAQSFFTHFPEIRAKIPRPAAGTREIGSQMPSVAKRPTFHRDNSVVGVGTGSSKSTDSTVFVLCIDSREETPRSRSGPSGPTGARARGRATAAPPTRRASASTRCEAAAARVSAIKSATCR